MLAPLYPLSNIKISISITNLGLMASFQETIYLEQNGTYVINLEDKKNKGTHPVSLFIDRNTAVYFDSLEIEYIPQEVLKKMKDKSVTYIIFGMQDDDSIMCGVVWCGVDYVRWWFYCIAFMKYMLEGKTLLDYAK